MSRSIRSTLVFLIVLLAAAAQAQVPQALTYQGVLTEADGTLRDGVAVIDLELYPDAQGGSALWSEQQLVAVDAGLFQVVLGDPANPLPLAGFAGALFLEVAIDGEILTPRQPLTSVPHALRAEEARLLEGRSAADLDQSGAVGALSNQIAKVDIDVDILTARVADTETNPILGLEDVVTQPFPGTVAVDGELVLRGGSVPLTVADGVVGIIVQAATQDGVRANSVDPTGAGFGGFFSHSGPTSNLGSGVFALGNQGDAPDIVLGANDSSTKGDDGRIASDPAHAGSDIVLDTNDDLFIQLDKDQSGEPAHFNVRGTGGATVFDVDESGNVDIPGAVSIKGPLTGFQEVSVSTEKGSCNVLSGAQAGFCALSGIDRKSGGFSYECKATQDQANSWFFNVASSADLLGNCKMTCKFICF